jgi:hypothetical protein
LTKKGREQQAAELQRLDECAERLQAQAGRNYQALTERQFQAEQRDRIRTARELKDFRRDHEDMRQQHIRDHQANRERKVEGRAQDIRRHTAEQALKLELQRQAERTRARADCAVEPGSAAADAAATGADPYPFPLKSTASRFSGPWRGGKDSRPLSLPVANRNHRRVGSQSSDGRAQNDCNRPDGLNPQSLRVNP